MTKAKRKQIVRVCGENFEEIEIPAYIRQRDARQRSARQEQEDVSPDYPLGGMLEPYDIEREQALVEKYERDANELILSEC